MITNFEEITPNITDIEKELSGALVNLLSDANNNNPMVSTTIVEKMKQHDNKFGQVKLRRISNYLRTNRIVPLIATSKGYYISDSQAEIKREIKSLRERANSINNAADGLEGFLLPQPTIDY